MLHVYPHSTVHAHEHPSSAIVLPSSHPSDVVTTLLPHTSWQLDRPHAELLHSHPSTSPLQSSRHPSAAPPSSHTSLPASIESPHVVEHTLGSAVLHVYPHSTVHVDEHPSSDTVLPSSHPSFPMRLPSPHIVLHADPEHGPLSTHAYASSTAPQSPLHPSPSTVFPSSHASAPVMIESPHVVLHVSAVVAVPPLHVYPHSTVHVDEHPSLSSVFPSSQKLTIVSSAPRV